MAEVSLDYLDEIYQCASCMIIELSLSVRLQNWMETMLESKKEKDKDKKASVPDLDLQKFIHYDIEVGANVMLEQAFGLPGRHTRGQTCRRPWLSWLE